MGRKIFSNYKKMLSLLVTETAINEVGKHNLFNNITKNLLKKNIYFKILTFKSNEKKKVYSNRNLNVEVVKSKKFNLKILNYIYLFFLLVKIKPNHLTIGGYGYVQNWIALIYAVIFNKKKTIWTGASETTTLNKNFLLNNLKSFFVKRFDNSIVYGVRAKDYLLKLGFKKKIFLSKNISDIEFFSKKNFLYLNKTKKNKKRIKFIFCARLVHHKGIDYLIKTFKKINRNKYHLTIIGDGPLSFEIKRNIRSKKINASYIRNLNQLNLANIFRKSDVFVSTTFNDPFSRTLSEAISAKCYCVSSIYDDASFDLITKQNGIIYDPKKINSLFYILNKIIEKPHLIKENLVNINLRQFNTKIYSTIFSNCILNSIYD